MTEAILAEYKKELDKNRENYTADKITWKQFSAKVNRLGKKYLKKIQEAQSLHKEETRGH